jgi:hypothetical protein
MNTVMKNIRYLKCKKCKDLVKVEHNIPKIDEYFTENYKCPDCDPVWDEVFWFMIKKESQGIIKEFEEYFKILDKRKEKRLEEMKKQDEEDERDLKEFLKKRKINIKEISDTNKKIILLKELKAEVSENAMNDPDISDLYKKLEGIVGHKVNNKLQ